MRIGKEKKTGAKRTDERSVDFVLVVSIKSKREPACSFPLPFSCVCDLVIYIHETWRIIGKELRLLSALRHVKLNKEGKGGRLMCTFPCTQNAEDKRRKETEKGSKRKKEATEEGGDGKEEAKMEERDAGNQFPKLCKLRLLLHSSRFLKQKTSTCRGIASSE